MNPMLRHLSIERFFTLILATFPFHPYLVDFLKLPNFWRQLFCYVSLLFLLLLELQRNRGRLTRSVVSSLCLFFLFMIVNVFGYVFGLIKGLPLGTINNAFLLSVGFLPLIVIMVILKKYLVFYLNLSWAVAALVSIGAIYEKVTSRHIVSDKYQSLNNLLNSEGVYRVGSVFGDALTLGPYLAIFFLYGLYMAKASRNKLFVYLLQFSIILGILFSGVRSAYVVTLAGILIFVMPRGFNLKFTKRGLKNSIVLSICLMFLFPVIITSSKFFPRSFYDFYSVQLSRVTNIFNTTEDVGNAGRINNYSLVITQTTKSLEDALFGVGYGLSTNYNPNITGGQVGDFSAENQYLKIIFEQGILGIVVFFIFVVVLFRAVMLVNSKERRVFIVILASFLLHMVFVPTLNSTFLNFLFYSFSGLFLASARSLNPVILGGKHDKY